MSSILVKYALKECVIMQEVNKNPELQLDENADWMTLILMSTLRALIGLELDRVVLFKL